MLAGGLKDRKSEQTQTTMKIIVFLFSMLFLQASKVRSQEIELLDSSQAKTSFRGMSCTTDGSLWVSGSNGSIGRSVNDGNNWEWVNPKGYEKRDFRDIVAFNARTAVTIAIDSPGVILKTTDGGSSWKEVYFNDHSGIFLDDLCFQDSLNGICAGDPMADGKMMLLFTKNGGDSWELFPANMRPDLAKGEAMFAASGGNMVALPKGNKYDYALVTGGTQSRLWYLSGSGFKNQPEALSLPIVQGEATTGANALIRHEGNYLIIGGDFSNPRNNRDIFISTKNGRNFETANQPNGYKSGLAATGRHLIAVGTTGVEWLYENKSNNSNPSMKSWVTVSEIPFHVVCQAPGTGIFYMAGPRGRIARLDLPTK